MPGESFLCDPNRILDGNVTDAREFSLTVRICNRIRVLSHFNIRSLQTSNSIMLLTQSDPQLNAHALPWTKTLEHAREKVRKFLHMFGHSNSTSKYNSTSAKPFLLLLLGCKNVGKIFLTPGGYTVSLALVDKIALDANNECVFFSVLFYEFHFHLYRELRMIHTYHSYRRIRLRNASLFPFSERVGRRFWK